jgi:hypothetical protein
VKGFFKNKASTRRNVGCDVACEAEVGSPLTAENSEITVLPMCNGQPPVKSLQKVIISMMSRILAKSKEYKSKKILSL